MSPTRSAALRSESMGTSWSSTDRKSTRLNSSHANISYAVFCLKKKNDIDAELCYLSFEIAFKSSAIKEAIEGVFEFVHDDCVIHILPPFSLTSFFFNDTATTEIYTLSLHDALPI